MTTTRIVTLTNEQYDLLIDALNDAYQYRTDPEYASIDDHEVADQYHNLLAQVTTPNTGKPLDPMESECCGHHFDTIEARRAHEIDTETDSAACRDIL